MHTGGKIYLPWVRQHWKFAAGKWFTVSQHILHAAPKRYHLRLSTLYAQYTCALKKTGQGNHNTYAGGVCAHESGFCCACVSRRSSLGAAAEKKVGRRASTRHSITVAVMWLRCARWWLICLCVCFAQSDAMHAACGANTCRVALVII